MCNVDLLYITFIDLQETASSGSSVRPKKMLEAFQTLGLSIKVLDGKNNDVLLRRKRVKEVLKWLKSNRPRMCYIEPPSGPFFCSADLRLLKVLHKKKVPIGLFYRDAYWMFPEFKAAVKGKGAIKSLKNCIIKYMQKRDLKVIQSTCAHVFFPSETMAAYFDMENKSALPPGCDENIISKAQKMTKPQLGEVINYLYVGGATLDYGTGILLEAFDKINREGHQANLILVCPKEQWENFDKGRHTGMESWLYVHHASGDAQLEQIYKDADVALVPRICTEYNDFAVPVKLFEYWSYQKPVIVTKCREMKKLVETYEAGWVIDDNAESLSSILLQLEQNRDEIIRVREKVREASEKNTWVKRADTIIEVLDKK